MIFFFGGGGLGNQMFQYVFLKKHQQKNEKIITLGLEGLLDVFNIDDVRNFNKKNKFIRILFNKLIIPFFVFLSDKKIISSIKVDTENILEFYSRETNSYSTSHGLIKWVTYIYSGYFQSESFFEKKDTESFVLKEEYLDEALDFLKEIGKEVHTVFVHIRRGDYKVFTVFSESPLLPMSYFKNQIKWFQENQSDVYFVFLSDEPEFVQKEFSFLPNKIISHNLHVGVDLAIMTLCNSAILSPSSFGWWGGYLMKNRKMAFAPKYWLGFNSRIEYPLGSVPAYAREVDVYTKKVDITIND